MKTILLAALFVCGVALAAPSGASAAGVGSGISKAANSMSLVEEAYCRSRRVCWRGPYGRRHCAWRRYCW